MSTAAAVVVAVVLVAIVVAFVVVGLAALRTWSDDRRDQRRLIADQGQQWGPAGSLAAGVAWTSIVGDGPPALRLRARGIGAETGASTTASTTALPSVDPVPATSVAGGKTEPPSAAQRA